MSLVVVLYGHNVTQRAVRGASRELRAAARYATPEQGAKIARIQALLEELDEEISSEHAKASDPTELFPERGIHDGSPSEEDGGEGEGGGP